MNKTIHKFAWALISIAVLFPIQTSFLSNWIENPGLVWGSKPILSYFVLTARLVEEMQERTNFTETQWEHVQDIARNEAYQLKRLEEMSRNIVAHPQLPMWLKRLGIYWMGYNLRVNEVVELTDRSLQEELGYPAYFNLVQWIENRWRIEQQIHAKPAIYVNANSRSFQVYATRYDSGGAYYVALPDKCVKFTNGGNNICSSDGYVVGQKYSVYLSYTNSVGAIVGESGPWNVDDNYWSNWNDPTPRRMFADLPMGMPEAQAAYFNGYNGGLDQFGRKVTGPFGIDLARQVSIDIGLQPGINDWITVSFLWTEGWDDPAVSGTQIPGVTRAAPATALAIVPVQVATPMPDGSIVHIVEYGQTLWEIGIAYQISLRTLYGLNTLADGSVIRPGDKLVIQPPGAVTPSISRITETRIQPTNPLNVTQTPEVSPSFSIFTMIAERNNSQDIENPESAKRSSNPQPGYEGFLFLGVGLVGVGLILVVLGRMISRK